ncbi:hypothetical protein ISREJYDI_CDS0016 [Pseudomonas phage UNO-G1W1]|jgi:hypothetical protein|uniref:Uncharacterized protein n=1 Tax=Pseudomonas phage UNO-G1W1 TaxID=3136609 RepID=A0AAX4MVM4_9CAUD
MSHGIYLNTESLKETMRLVYAVKQMLGRDHKVRVGRQDGRWYVAI